MNDAIKFVNTIGIRKQVIYYSNYFSYLKSCSIWSYAFHFIILCPILAFL